MCLPENYRPNKEIKNYGDEFLIYYYEDLLRYNFSNRNFRMFPK